MLLMQFLIFELACQSKPETPTLEMPRQSLFFNQRLSPNGNKLALLFNYNFIPDLCLACLKVGNTLWHKIGPKEEGARLFNEQ